MSAFTIVKMSPGSLPPEGGDRPPDRVDHCWFGMPRLEDKAGGIRLQLGSEGSRSPSRPRRKGRYERPWCGYTCTRPVSARARRASRTVPRDVAKLRRQRLLRELVPGGNSPRRSHPGYTRWPLT